MRHDFVQTVNRTLEDIDYAAIDAEISRLVGEGETLLERSAVTFTGRDTFVACDMLYLGQTHTVATAIDWRKDRAVDAAMLRQAFERRYREVYGRLLEGIPIRVLNVHVALVGRRPKLDLVSLAPSGGRVEAARQGTRQVYFSGKWWDAAVYARHQLPVGAQIGGPAILEQQDATIVVEPELRAHVDRFGNVIIERRTT
jgi:N-methylhydantoinase A